MKTCHLCASVECGWGVKYRFNQGREQLDIKKCDSEYKTKLLDFSRCLFLAKQSCFAPRIPKIRLIDQPEKDTKPQANFFSRKLPFLTVMKDPKSTCSPRTSSELCNCISITWQGLMGVKSHPWLFLSPFNSFQLPLEWAAQDGCTAPHWALTHKELLKGMSSSL